MVFLVNIPLYNISQTQGIPMPGFFAPLAFAFSVIHMAAGDLEGYLSFLKVSVQKWPVSLYGYVLLATLSYKATN